MDARMNFSRGANLWGGGHKSVKGDPHNFFKHALKMLKYAYCHGGGRGSGVASRVTGARGQT